MEQCVVNMHPNTKGQWDWWPLDSL